MITITELINKYIGILTRKKILKLIENNEINFVKKGRVFYIDEKEIVEFYIILVEKH